MSDLHESQQLTLVCQVGFRCCENGFLDLDHRPFRCFRMLCRHPEGHILINLDLEAVAHGPQPDRLSL